MKTTMILEISSIPVKSVLKSFSDILFSSFFIMKILFPMNANILVSVKVEHSLIFQPVTNAPFKICC